MSPAQQSTRAPDWTGRDGGQCLAGLTRDECAIQDRVAIQDGVLKTL